MTIATMMCSRHGNFLGQSSENFSCPGCAKDTKNGEMYVVKHEVVNDMEARASFRYRLREAARQALELGDALLQLSQDATEPDNEQLNRLRDMESSLNISRYWSERIVPKP